MMIVKPRRKGFTRFLRGQGPIKHKGLYTGQHKVGLALVEKCLEENSVVTPSDELFTWGQTPQGAPFWRKLYRSNRLSSEAREYLEDIVAYHDS